MMTACRLILCFATISILATASLDPELPDGPSDRFKKEGIWDRYDISGRVNPFYLRADFDGDNRPDYAILISSRANNEEELAIVLSSQAHVVLIPQKGNRPFDAWQVVDRGTKLEEGPRLKNDGLVVQFGGPGFVLAWTGKKFDSFKWGE